MASHAPDVSLQDFLDSIGGDDADQTIYGTIVGALALWDAQHQGRTAKKNAEHLVSIIVDCRQWLKGQAASAIRGGGIKLGRARDTTGPVKALVDKLFSRLQYEHYERNKSGSMQGNLKSLAEPYHREAMVLNKQEYKNSHAGANALEFILRGFGRNDPLPQGQKAMVTAYAKQNLPDGKGGHIKNIDKLSDQQWRDLEQFVTQNNIASDFRQQYFSKDDRIGHLLIPSGGKWLVKVGEPLDTKGQAAIYVVDKYGNWYAHLKGEGGIVNHSTLCRGQPILCAGMFIVSDGKLEYIDNQSGHYQPPRKNLKRALNTIAGFVDWNRVGVKIVGPGNRKVTFGPAPCGNAQCGVGNCSSPVAVSKFLHSSNAAGNHGEDFKGWPPA